MGFIKAFTGALSGTLADQWKDFYVPKSNVSATAAVFPAVPQGTNRSRGENTKGNDNIISNGSKIIVPEGTALVTMQDGAITGIVAEPGGFIFSSDDVNSQSIFAGDNILSTAIHATWEKVKFGGQPGSQQLAFYVNLKEIPNNKFGTQSEIYWDDAFFATQVGAITRGTYSLKIIDPLLFMKNFVPAKYLIADAPVFDFADMDNDAGAQLFNEVVGSLSAAFSIYTNDPTKGNRMTRIQGDQIGFAKAMGQAVEEAYQWKSDRGLEIVKTAILAIEYDDDTKEMMKDVKRADALSGSRGNSFMQQSVARGMQAAGETGGGANMAFMGMGMNASGNVMGGMQQPNTESTYQPGFGKQQQETQNVSSGTEAPQQPKQEDITTKLLEMKKLLDAGVLSQEEFDQIKKKLLGL
ncbi:SPFH domain-containing protein [Streptococcus zalophi]|uniref:SPFH domain-containing protein n=1 Tax=Streptococcus zalophi TaxID=640031 RepID=A0A934UDB0_9STRE|nr:SPFH domain-containing protein [Streptococcus zalophi]MBJ8349488.1 SPFH domain-containing protein [Streptococcus zalophi]